MSINRGERARVLAALREIYDGSWTRLLGEDGGRALTWQGKCGFIGACTPSIDRAHAVMGALGERFVLYRLTVNDPNEQGRRRLRNRGHEREMRDDLYRVVSDVLAAMNGDPRAPLSTEEVDWLVAWACFAVVARSAVERDGYDRQVELLPEPEAPGRLVGALGQLCAGLAAIGLTDEERWQLLAKVALDSIPTVRRAVLDALRGEWLSSSMIVDRTGIPRTTTGRTDEDLTLLGLVKVARVNGAEPHFGLSDTARSTWPEPCPEMSGDHM
jgi:hypothetical protein